MSVYKDGKVGFIYSTGRLVIPCEYDNASYFSEGFAPVEKNGKWGFIDTNGRLVIPCEYEYGDIDTCDGNILCLKNGYLYVLDATGKLLFP